MPIYEYQCTICGHEMEALQGISEDVLKNCPNCNKPGLNRLISAAGFKLTGTGWYATDFKNSGKKGDNQVEAKGKANTKNTSDAQNSESVNKSSTQKDAKNLQDSSSFTKGAKDIGSNKAVG